MLEFFRAPADGFMTDGLLGMGYGLKLGLQALVVGAVGGTFEYVAQLTGSFCTVLYSIGRVGPKSRSGGLKEVGNNLAGAVLRPYRGAKADGAAGFGRGLIDATVSVLATVLALPFAAVNLLAGGVAKVASGLAPRAPSHPHPTPTSTPHLTPPDPT